MDTGEEVRTWWAVSAEEADDEPAEAEAREAEGSGGAAGEAEAALAACLSAALPSLCALSL